MEHLMRTLSENISEPIKNYHSPIKCIYPLHDENDTCTSLAIASKLNHYHCVQRALDVLVVDNDQFSLLQHQTCLYIATDNNSYETVKVFLEKGFRPNTKAKYLQWNRVTPLHIACRNLSVKLIQLLLEKGANINETDEKNETCLHYIIRYDY